MTQSGFIDLKESKVYYRTEGTGPPCILANYIGGLAYQRMFSKNLRNHIQLIFTDLGGGGGESVPRKLVDISFDSLSEEIEAIRNELDLDEFVLLGASANVKIVLEYVKRHPSRVSHLVLVGGGPTSDSSSIKKRTQEYWSKYASEERKATWKKNLEKLGNIRFYDDAPTFYAAHTPRFWKDYSIDVMPIFEGIEANYNVLEHLFMNVFNDFDSSSYLSEIKCPVLLIMGKYDFSNPPSLWDGYRELIPDLTYFMLDDSGHNPMMEIPEKFDKILVDWIKTH